MPRQRLALVFALVAASLPLTTLAFTESRSREATTLATAGSAALDERRFGDALEAFTRAAAILPGDSSLCAGAGLAAFMLGQTDAARGWFERALQLDPRYLVASEWLGELHYRAGRGHEAIAVYEAALRNRSSGRSRGASRLEAKLAEWRKETALHDGFHASRGAHFTVLFEGPADQALAQVVVDRLEAAYWRIGAALSTYPREPVTVVLYTDERFRDIPQLPAWTAAAYDGRIRVPIRGALEDVEALDRVLGHEFVHAVVATLAGRNVPVWLNEGLATALEPEGAESAEQLLAQTEARPRLQHLHGSFLKFDDDEAGVAYAMSTRAVRRLIDRTGTSAIVTLLRDLGRGDNFAGAFHRRVAMRYDEFQASVARQ